MLDSSGFWITSTASTAQIQNGEVILSLVKLRTGTAIRGNSCLSCVLVTVMVTALLTGVNNAAVSSFRIYIDAESKAYITVTCTCNWGSKRPEKIWCCKKGIKLLFLPTVVIKMKDPQIQAFSYFRIFLLSWAIYKSSEDWYENSLYGSLGRHNSLNVIILSLKSDVVQWSIPTDMTLYLCLFVFF